MRRDVLCGQWRVCCCAVHVLPIQCQYHNDTGVCVCVCAICCRWHGLDGESTGEQAIERRSVRVPGAGEPAIALDWRGSNQCEGDLRCVGKLSGIFWQ